MLACTLIMTSDSKPCDSGVRPLCPSAQAKPGALLLGRVKKDNSVAFLKEPVKVGQEFMDTVKDAVPEAPEYAFRFASPCLEKGCSQWKSGNCGVSGFVKEALPDHTADSLPKCAIRENCRWFLQDGASICYKCIFVTTRRHEKHD